MRIILLLAATLGVAAIGAAAPAQTGHAGPGRGGGPNGGWHPGTSGPAFDLLRPSRAELRRGRGHHRHHRRHRRHHRDDRGQDFGFLYPFGAIAGPFAAVDPHGNGFFAGAGGRVSLDGGRPYYDYDRSYPYEWASAAGGGHGPAADESRFRPELRCAVENRVRVCRGGR